MKKKEEKNPSGNRVLRWLGRLTPRALWARFALDRWLTPFAAGLWLLALLWAIVVFFLGQQTGTESAGVSSRVVEWLTAIFPALKGAGDSLHLVVRKLAHAFAFFLLAVLALSAARRTFHRRRRATFWTMAVIALLAVANEVEQHFVPGRCMSALDVLIDISGALVGGILVLLIGRLRGKYKRKRDRKTLEEAIFDKRARWLTAVEFARQKPVNPYFETPTPDPANEGLQHFHMYARRAFRLSANVQSAELLISADDMYKLYINGEYVAQGPAPGYPGRYYVNRIDVLKYLRAGDNVLALDVYYQGLINRVWVSGDLRQGFICDLRVDGKSLVRSDEHFHYVRSASRMPGETYGYATGFNEKYDSREEPEGWKNLGFDDFMWTSPSVCEQPDYHFVEQETPVLATWMVEPEKVTRDGAKITCDFGRELSGVLLVKAAGAAGKRVFVRTGEELNEDGSVRVDGRQNCRYEDEWTLADGACAYEMYEYRGFRYVELEAEDGVRLTDVRARAQGYPMDDAACTLETDDENLKAVFELCRHTIRVGVQEGYLDCPTREKGEYSGDLAVTSLAQVYLSGDTRLLRKAIEDWLYSANLTPGLLAVFPSAFQQRIADYSLLMPEVALRDYAHTGDKAFLRRTCDAAAALLKVFEAYAREDGLLEKVVEGWNLVDWPANLRDEYDFPLTLPIGEGCHNVINAFYIGAVRAYETMRKLLDEEFTPKSPALVDAFDRAFYRLETGLYADSETSAHSAVHSNILPLYFGFVARDKRARVADYLVERGICIGVYMAFFQLKALARAGRYDEVYRLLTGGGEHSWKNMLDEGATTLFEAWGKEQKWNTSLCHPWASAPVSVLIEDILGITPDVARGEIWRSHLPESVRYLRMVVPVAGQLAVFTRENGQTTLILEQKG